MTNVVIGPAALPPFVARGLCTARAKDDESGVRTVIFAPSAVEGGRAREILEKWKDDPLTDVRALLVAGDLWDEALAKVVLATGGTVGVIADEQAASLLGDEDWGAHPHCLPLPADRMTIAAFVEPRVRLADSTRHHLAKLLHEHYRADEVEHGRFLTEPMLAPWESLAATYRRANLDAADGLVAVVERTGHCIDRRLDEVWATNVADDIEQQLDELCEYEHGRWIVSRLRDGWRFGSKRDDAARLHPKIVPWSQLEPQDRSKDKANVRAAPRILLEAQQRWGPLVDTGEQGGQSSGRVPQSGAARNTEGADQLHDAMAE